MPSKKKKYNARFPAGRIKKIMQTDEEVGKVAQAVPVIISRTLELFVESLLTKSVEVTNKRNAKTLSPSHVKQCILSESRFDFLKDLVKSIPDISQGEEKESVQTVSAESSPNSNRFSDAGCSLANPGPSNVRRPKQSHKKDNGQSSDSGSDYEPIQKRVKSNYGNGRQIPKTAPNFDEELRAFVQKRIQSQNKRITSPTSDSNSDNFAVPSALKVASAENNNNKQRLPNFYKETLPDTSIDEEKEKNKPAYSSVIQPNPEYKNAKNFGFYTSNKDGNNLETNSSPLPNSKLPNQTDPSLKENAESMIPKYHIELGKNFSVQPSSNAGKLPMYHLDFSAMPISTDNSMSGRGFMPTVIPQFQVLTDGQLVGAKKTPPPLQTLKRSASLPDPSPALGCFSPSPSKGDPGKKFISIAPKDEAKSRIERSSYSFDSSTSPVSGQRKNEPPLLLPINLIHKAPQKAPKMELDEDYDT